MKAEFLCKNYCCAFCFDMACIRSTRCDNRIKPTNADSIRNMTDDELADALGRIEQGDFWMELSWLEWLKQEVE